MSKSEQGGGVFDVIVVGGGVVGSSAAYDAASRALSCLLIEQFPAGHSRGSSHGKSRILRHMYGARDMQYAAMVPAALRLWQQLQRLSGHQLIRQVGGVFISAREEAVTANKQCLEQLGVEHEKLSSSQLSQRFPQFSIADAVQGLFEPSMCLLNADKCVQALQERFVAEGGKLLEMHPVQKLNRIPEGMEVVTASGSFRCRKLILTPGPWINNMLALLGKTRLDITVEPIDIGYYPTSKRGEAERQLVPRVILFADEHNVIPPFEYAGMTRVISVHEPTPHDPHMKGTRTREQGRHSLNPDLRDNPAEMDSWRATLDGEQESISKFIQSSLPGVSPQPAIIEKCMYSVSADAGFVLDRHPQYPEVVVGAGFSGHGFKMAPVVGQILVRLALGEQPGYDISSMNFARLAKAD